MYATFEANYSYFWNQFYAREAFLFNIKDLKLQAKKRQGLKFLILDEMFPDRTKDAKKIILKKIHAESSKRRAAKKGNMLKETQPEENLEVKIEVKSAGKNPPQKNEDLFHSYLIKLG